MKISLALATLATVLSSVQAINCATGPTDFTMTGLSWTPSPACVGKPLCITVSGILNNDIVDGGVVSMIGRYFGRVVYTDDYLLCDFLAANGMTCPIPVTTTTATFCHTIKPEAPTGIPVEMTYEFVNGNGNILYCEKTIGAMAMNC